MNRIAKQWILLIFIVYVVNTIKRFLIWYFTRSPTSFPSTIWLILLRFQENFWNWIGFEYLTNSVRLSTIFISQFFSKTTIANTQLNYHPAYMCKYEQSENRKIIFRSLHSSHNQKVYMLKIPVFLNDLLKTN